MAGAIFLQTQCQQVYCAYGRAWRISICLVCDCSCCLNAFFFLLSSNLYAHLEDTKAKSISSVLWCSQFCGAHLLCFVAHHFTHLSGASIFIPCHIARF